MACEAQVENVQQTTERCSNDSPRTKIRLSLRRPRNKDDGNTRDKGQILQQDGDNREKESTIRQLF